MTEEIKETEIGWDDLKLDGAFVKFESNVRTKVKVTNWRLVAQEGKKYGTEEKEIQQFFKCDVLEQDGKESEKKISTSSKPLLRGMKAILQDLDTASEVMLSIKKLGEKSATTYDVELAQ